jgi:DNA (cytosine-5)-methyltransferase 1
VKVLDLYSGAGGAARGYQLAGHDVHGVDILPQRRYPGRHTVADALEYLVEHGSQYDLIHASPPCNDHSVLSRVPGNLQGTGWMVEATREALWATGKPYVIENVPGAPLQDPVILCGSMFGLGAECTDGYRQLRRHRLFESNFYIPQLTCNHQHATIGVYGGGPVKRKPGGGRGGYQGLMHERREAMGIDWMIAKELNLAIPPAYTQYIGSLF